MQTMRDLMTLCEAAVTSLAAQKEAWVSSLIKIMDERSIAAILEVDDSDPGELADAWFDSCIAIYHHIEQMGKCPIYRHMMVEDFKTFLQSLNTGTGRLGEYWSIHYSIESPTWKQDQQGDVPVSMEGEIAANQIDWEATLRQNFEWPHEGELIFTGDVLVRTIEDRDTGTEVHPNRQYPR